MNELLIFVSGIVVFAASVLFVAGMVSPNMGIFSKFSFLDGKSNGTKRLYIGLISFCLMFLASAPVNLINDDRSVSAEPEATIQTRLVNIEDDAILMRLKRQYDMLLSFKDSPDFHFYGFGEGGKYRSWYMASHNFTNDDNLHLMRTYGVASGDILQLGQEYLTSKGKETDYSRNMRKTLDDIFSHKTWEVSE